MNKPPIDTSPQAVLRRRYKALRDEGYNEDFCRFAKVAADSLDAKDMAIDMLTGERDALAAKVARVTEHANFIALESLAFAARIAALDNVANKAHLLLFAMRRDEWPGHNHTYVKDLREALAAACSAPETVVPTGAGGNSQAFICCEGVGKHEPGCTALETVAKPSREALRDAFAAALTGVYCCTRVWSAWQVGTMDQDDFIPAAECEEVLDSLVDAAFTSKTKMKP